MKKFGDHIKELREKLGLRPEHLAAAANVSVATIYNLESNKYTIRADRLFPLARALKVKPTYLLSLLAAEAGEAESESEPTAAALIGV